MTVNLNLTTKHMYTNTRNIQPRRRTGLAGIAAVSRPVHARSADWECYILVVTGIPFSRRR